MSMIQFFSMIGSTQTQEQILFNTLSNEEAVLLASGTGDETLGMRGPEVFDYDTNTIGLTYMAREASSGGGRVGIKLATAPKTDENNFTKLGVIIPSGINGEWDYEIGAGGSVIKVGNTWYVYYAGSFEGKVGLATGTDLTALTKHQSNPLIDYTASSNFDKYLRHPSVIEKDGTYYMFYDARAAGPYLLPHAIGRSTSTDLINWTRDPVPVIDCANIPLAWGDITASPEITKIGDLYYLFMYSGTSNSDVPGGNRIDGPKIIYATSPDLEVWTLVTEELPFVRLFGYDNNLTSFGEACYYYINGNHYIYSLTQKPSGLLSVGRGLLGVGTFDDTLPSPLLEDTFTGTTIDTLLYDVDIDSNGVAISQNDELIITSDGSETAGVHNITTKDTYSGGGMIQAIFDVTRTADIGPFVLAGFSDGAGNTFGYERGTATDANIVIRSVADGNTTFSTAIGYDFKLKIILEGHETRFYYWNTITSKWKFIDKISKASFFNISDFKFIVQQGNLSGSPVTLTIDNLQITNFEFKSNSI